MFRSIYPRLKEYVFFEIQCLLFFSLLNGISESRSFKIRRRMKKYAQGLILRFFGQLGGPNGPPTPPNPPQDPPGNPSPLPHSLARLSSR